MAKAVWPLSSEHGTYKTVKARFWPWLSGKPFKWYRVHELVVRAQLLRHGEGLEADEGPGTPLTTGIPHMSL